MSRAESLHRLQQIDTELDAARKRGKEIDTQLKGTPALQHARGEFARAEAAMKSAGATYKALEEDAEVIDIKLQGEEQRLYAGNIRSPKEMLDVEHELAALRKRRAGMDENLLAALEQVEQARIDFAACKAALEHAERNFNDDNVHLREEWDQLGKTVRARLEQRQALSTALTKADLDLYNALRAKKPNGIAVAMIKAGACSQCGTLASSQLAQQARTGSAPALCPNCGRILFAA